MKKPNYNNPDGVVDNKKYYRSLVVNFETEEKYIEFLEKLDISLNAKTKEIHFEPKTSIDRFF